MGFRLVLKIFSARKHR